MPDRSVLHVLPSPTAGFKSPLGVLHCYDLGPSVVLHACMGEGVREFAELVTADGDRKIRETGRCVFMVDGWESTRMSTGFRETMTQWFRNQNGRAFANLLLRSKVMELGINVANMLLGVPVAKAYTNITEWERVGAREVSGFRRRPVILPPEL